MSLGKIRHCEEGVTLMEMKISQIINKSNLTPILRGFLGKHGGSTISLTEMERVVPGRVEYHVFVSAVQQLMGAGILVPIKAQGTNQAQPALPNGYRIKKQRLKADFFEEIRNRQLSLHFLLQIDCYFKKSEALWQIEQPWLDTLQNYLVTYGLPQSEASVWQRSYEIMGDEKWISESGGHAFLQRVGIFEKLKIVDLVEPLMFALNPRLIQDKVCYHLIVENKTTYDALAEVLPETAFLTLIYGAGKCFLNSITQLESQLHMPNAQHCLFYFGDLDLEGITIWYLLHKRRQASLALPFYEALLNKNFKEGKTNQRKDSMAYAEFCAKFTTPEQQTIHNLFNNRGYYPQEALSARELQDIGRTTWWKDI